MLNLQEEDMKIHFYVLYVLSMLELLVRFSLVFLG